MLLRRIHPGFEYLQDEEVELVDELGIDHLALKVGQALGDQRRHHTLGWRRRQTEPLELDGSSRTGLTLISTLARVLLFVNSSWHTASVRPTTSYSRTGRPWVSLRPKRKVRHSSALRSRRRSTAKAFPKLSQPHGGRFLFSISQPPSRPASPTCSNPTPPAEASSVSTGRKLYPASCRTSWPAQAQHSKLASPPYHRYRRSVSGRLRSPQSTRSRSRSAMAVAAP